MTKKHFEVIALQINELKKPKGQNWSRLFAHAVNVTCEDLAVNLADQFEQINPNFNRSMFLAVALA